MKWNIRRFVMVAAICSTVFVGAPSAGAQSLNKAPTVTGSGCAQAVEAWKGLSSSNSVEALKGFRAGVPKTCPDQLAAASARIAKLEAAAASRPKASGRAGATSGRVFRDCADCPEMVTIPAGSFWMGSPAGEGEANEQPQRRIKLPEFAAGRYEVTWADWGRCVADGGCPPLKADEFGGGMRPVTYASWTDAKAYASWLSDRTGKAYRLLSEAEWEYAARGGTTTPYSTGTSISASQANFSGDKTTSVGQYPANAFGLYDMHGNVFEWVEDCYEASYSAGQPTNGRAFTNDSCTNRVIRGGSWYLSPQLLRSASRSRDAPAIRVNLLGFRLARTLP